MESELIKSTLCYIEKDENFLMLFRNKEADDPCLGKWLGVGGKFEPGESKDECLLREVREETGLTLTDYTFCGIIHFKSDVLPDEDMYLYTASGFDGELKNDGSGHILNYDEICDEGTLYWVPKEKVLTLNLWEGDKYFLKPLIAGKTDIEITCVYEGDRLINVSYPLS